MSSSDWPFSRRAWKARNWSSGCSGARWTFSANESSSGGDVDAGIAHDAGHRRGLGEALLFDEQLERPVAPPASRDLEHAGLGALGIEHRPDVEALQERAPGDVLGQLLDRDAGLHAPDVRLGQNKLVEGDVARRRQGDLLNGSSHRDGLRDGRRRLSLGFQPVTKTGAALFLWNVADPPSRRYASAQIRLCVTACSLPQRKRITRPPARLWRRPARHPQ